MEPLKVTKQSCKVVIVLLLLSFISPLFGAATKPASVLLQEGMYAEEVEGKLDEAIKIYQQLISASQQTEQAAAQATYRIGLCYLKKGDNEHAAQQFKELILKFPKQESLVKEAQKQLEKLQPPVSDSFGPVIERIVNDDDEGLGDFLIDLDSGVLFSPPTAAKTEQERLNWVADNHIDAVGDTRKSGPGLYGFDMAVIPLANARWEGLSQQELVKELSIAKSGTPVLLSADGALPKTYMFKTREGGIGVLQILEMQDKNKPRHFKIRYKMLRQEHEVFLPDTNNTLQQGNVPAILDLSTGKLVPGSPDKQYFKQLNEGDIAYSDDEGKDILACFRGEKITRKLENGQYSDAPDQIHKDTNMNLYIIKIPSDMFITTKEGDTYELKILSKLSKGLNIKYTKIPPMQLRATANKENEIKTIVANFFKAVSQKHDDDAMGMMLYEKTRAERTVKGFQTLPNIGEVRADEIYSTQNSALVVTTEISGPEGVSERGRFAIRLVRKYNTWLIEEFDTDIDEEIEAFKKESETNSNKDTNNTIQVLEKKPSDEEMLRSYFIACGTLCDSIRVALSNDDFESAEKLCQDVEMQIEKGLKLTSQSEQSPMLESLASQFKVWHEAIKAKDKEKAIRLGEALNHAGGLVNDFIMDNKSNDEK